MNVTQDSERSGHSPNQGVAGGEEAGREDWRPGGPFAGCKISDVIRKPFDGSGDVVAWFRQAKTCKRVMRMTQDKAYAVYLELPEEDQLKFTKIEEALLTVFAEDVFTATKLLQERKYRAGEGADVFANELKRLGRIARANDTTIKVNFINGLPADIPTKMRSTLGVKDMELPAILEMARGMVKALEESLFEPATAAAAAAPATPPGRNLENTGCYTCNGPHLERNCPKLRAEGGQSGEGRGCSSGWRGGYRGCGRGGGRGGRGRGQYQSNLETSGNGEGPSSVPPSAQI